MLRSVALNLDRPNSLRKSAFAVTLLRGNTIESISVFILLILSDALDFFILLLDLTSELHCFINWHW